MKLVELIAREVFGLFVDDGTFAVAILAWLALAGLGAPRLGIAPAWQGFILFAGLAVLLVASVVRRARFKVPPR